MLEILQVMETKTPVLLLPALTFDLLITECVVTRLYSLTCQTTLYVCFDQIL